MPAIWLIEDNSAYQRAVIQTLRNDGNLANLRSFSRCEDAIAAIKQGEFPDVVLMDVGLPGMDGIEGIRAIVGLHEETNVIMLTVFEDDDKIFRAVCAGARGYLLKSEPVESILAAISQAMAGGSPMNSRIARRVNEMFSKLATPGEDYKLSARERDVLQSMVQGLPHKQIPEFLGLTPSQVDYSIRCIYRKLRVNCVASAVMVAVKDRLVRNH